MQTQILTGNDVIARGLYARDRLRTSTVKAWGRGSDSIDNTVHSGYATSPYRPIWSVAVCATDVTDVSKDYKWLLALQCTKTAENIAGNV